MKTRALLFPIAGLGLAATLLILDGRSPARAAQVMAPNCIIPRTVGALRNGLLPQRGDNSVDPWLIFEDSAGTVRFYRGCELVYKFGRE
jgi:hypothetical protein